MASRGNVWERVCNNSERLRQDGRLVWCRMHPPILKVGPGMKKKSGSFLAVRTGKGPPDWVALTNSLSIIGDDKDCKTQRGWATANIKKHQAKHFDWWESHGGIACILLRMPDRSRWVIPWKNIKEHWESGIIVKPTFITSIGFKWQYSDDKEPNYDWLTPLLQWHHEVSQ